MTISDVPAILITASFGLLMLAFSQLARIQVEAIAHLRRISAREAKDIYYRDYTDGDGATFSWSEMCSYCRSTGGKGRLYFWCVIVLASIAGGIGAIILDKALR